MTIDEAAATLIADMKKMEAAIPNDTEYGKAVRQIVREMKIIDEHFDTEEENEGEENKN